MKCPKRDDRKNTNNKRKNRNLRNQLTNKDQVTEMLKICLQKVCELQAELQRSDDQEHDAEAAGYAACAIEALRFLSSEGVSQDHPMVKTLTQHLLRDRDQDY